MVDQNDVAGSSAGSSAGAAPSLNGGVAALSGWRKLKTTTVAALLCAGCVGALSGGATVALMNAAQGGGAGIPQAEWTRLSARVEAGGTESARLANDLSLLRDRTAQAHEAADKGRAEAGARLGQISERIERLQRQDGDLAGKVAALTERLSAMAERQEHADREQAARMTALVDRLEKADKRPVPVAAVQAPMAQMSSAQMSSAQIPAVPASTAHAPVTTKPVAAAEPALTGSLPDKPADKAKPPAIEGWVLRDVYDGMAMIENRNRRLVEVGPGDTLPGAGRIEAIERRGRSWVVVTTKGLITPQTW